jgi:DNA-binding MarR family transcriptional regulator
MPEQSLSESISYLIAQVCKAHHNCANDVLSQIGLYAGQEMFLLSLWYEDGLTQSQLVEHMCVQPATVSKMLSRMERAGLVERRGDLDDNRVTRVYLTERSRSLKQSVEEAWRELEERTVADLSLEERLLLRRLLLQVQKNLTDSE